MYHRRLSIIIVIITCCFASKLHASDASSGGNVWDIINGTDSSLKVKTLVDAVVKKSPLSRAYLVRVAIEQFFINNYEQDGIITRFGTRTQNISRVSDLTDEDLRNAYLVIGSDSVKDAQGVCGAIAIGYPKEGTSVFDKEILRTYISQSGINAFLSMAEQVRRLAEFRATQEKTWEDSIDLLILDPKAEKGTMTETEKE